MSRKIKGAEANYSYIEKQCLALIYSVQRLRHHVIAHGVLIVTKLDPIKYMLTKPIPTSRMAQWMLILSGLGISVIHPKAQKSQALSDLLAQCPDTSDDTISEEIPGGLPEIMTCEEENWILTFDGSSTAIRGGIGIILTDKQGRNSIHACKLSFKCTNNEAEYEALILGMMTAIKIGIKRLTIRGDSRLVIQQMKGEFAVNRVLLARNDQGGS